jgi:hypothetical protein
MQHKGKDLILKNGKKKDNLKRLSFFYFLLSKIISLDQQLL